MMFLGVVFSDIFVYNGRQDDFFTCDFDYFMFISTKYRLLSRTVQFL